MAALLCLSVAIQSVVVVRAPVLAFEAHSLKILMLVSKFHQMKSFQSLKEKKQHNRPMMVSETTVDTRCVARAKRTIYCDGF